MKKQNLSVLCCAMLITLIGCQKDVLTAEDQVVPESVITQIRGMGFGTDNIQLTEEGYLVEGDIIITPEMLNSNLHQQKLRIAEVEQYRTINLVTGVPRTITIATKGNIPAALFRAIDNAIARYNAENLTINFLRVKSRADITINLTKTIPNNLIAMAGFPTSNGDPYPTITWNKQFSNAPEDFMTTVIAHEIGHCIGFRHTDYMNRAYSCGGTPSNEGDDGVGAIHIPGTPTDPDAESWMLSCLGSASSNRPFNANDIIALNYLY